MNGRSYSQSIPAAWQTRAAFEVRGRQFSFREVIWAAEIRGDLSPVVQQSRRAQAREQRAEIDGDEPDMEAVEAMMDEFRYARSLVTVEETERWLEANGLTADDLSDHFLRRYWLTSETGHGDQSHVKTASARDVWPADVLISGQFVHGARKLAREAVCTLNHAPPSGSESQSLLAEFRRRRKLDDAAYQSWRAEWMLTDPAVAEMLFGRRSFERDCDAAVTMEARARVLAEQRMDLVRVELVVVEFDSEAAAHEAYLCVTEDGRTLEEVAAEAGFPLRQKTAFVRQFPENWHFPLMGALPGRTLAPLSNHTTFNVCRVLSHIEPQVSDPAIQVELDAVLLERKFGQSEAQEVRWLFDVESAE